MPDLSPAETLTAAAKKLRHEATEANRSSPAPWAVCDAERDVVRCADDGIVADRSRADHPIEMLDLPYIAAMHPGVGLALVDWLELAADVINSRTLADPTDEYTVDISDEHALVVARQILGGES